MSLVSFLRGLGRSHSVVSSARIEQLEGRRLFTTTMYMWEYEELYAASGVSASWSTEPPMPTEQSSVTLTLSGLPGHARLAVHAGIVNSDTGTPGDTDTITMSVPGGPSPSHEFTYDEPWDASFYEVFNHNSGTLSLTFSASDQEQLDRMYVGFVTVEIVHLNVGVQIGDFLLEVGDTTDADVTVSDEFGTPVAVPMTVTNYNGTLIRPTPSSFSSGANGTASFDIEALSGGTTGLEVRVDGTPYKSVTGDLKIIAPKLELRSEEFNSDHIEIASGATEGLNSVRAFDDASTNNPKDGLNGYEVRITQFDPQLLDVRWPDNAAFHTTSSGGYAVFRIRAAQVQQRTETEVTFKLTWKNGRESELKFKVIILPAPPP